MVTPTKPTIVSLRDRQRSVAMRLLLHGLPKTYKTRTAVAAPKPIILDADDGLKGLAGQDLDYVPCPTWETFADAVSWLCATDGAGYQSIVVDTVTAVQSALAEFVAPGRLLQQQDWGKMLTFLRTAISALCKLPLHLILTSHSQLFFPKSKDSEGQEIEGTPKWRPALGGKIGAVLSGMVDTVGFMDPEYLTGGERPIPVIRFESDGGFEAGDRLGIFPAVVRGGADVLAQIFAGKQVEMPAPAVAKPKPK